VNPSIRKAWPLPAQSEERKSILRHIVADNLRDQFLQEVGDQIVRNPDTGNDVKVVTLSSSDKDSKAYALYQKEFDRWKKSKEKKPTTKKETKPKWAGMTEDARFSWGKKQNRRRDFTADQESAIYEYTSDDYKAINDSLRKGGEPHETVKMLDGIFNSEAGKMDVAVTVRRGVSADHPLIKGLLDGSIQPGSSFKDPAYQSSTIVPDDDRFGEFFFQIDVPKGSRALYVGPPPYDVDEGALSANPDEEELIIDRGQTMEVVGYNPETKVVNVRLKT
jgi:hypothetical protein